MKMPWLLLLLIPFVLALMGCPWAVEARKPAAIPKHAERYVPGEDLTKFRGWLYCDQTGCVKVPNKVGEK